ncbi:MAG: hypothetical protein DRP08_08175 [Candidatus Aenigmatarchaeota archaeon]|nr:MAG: hypothetical protein DRP08_08175 [Candidatus Aenigmarchaeota archaeon]
MYIGKSRENLEKLQKFFRPLLPLRKSPFNRFSKVLGTRPAAQNRPVGSQKKKRGPGVAAHIVGPCGPFWGLIERKKQHSALRRAVIFFNYNIVIQNLGAKI